MFSIQLLIIYSFYPSETNQIKSLLENLYKRNCSEEFSCIIFSYDIMGKMVSGLIGGVVLSFQSDANLHVQFVY